MNAHDDPTELHKRILGELQCHSSVDVSRIRVSVGDGGAVSLEGVVPTYADKCAAETIVRFLPGVAGVRNELEVRLTIGDHRPDATLERVLRDLLDCLARMPADRPSVRVADGWVLLEGTVPRAFQKEVVENAVREVAGVRGLTNRIAVGTERRTARPPLASATSSVFG